MTLFRKNADRKGMTICVAVSTKTRIQKAVEEEINTRIEKGELISAIKLKETLEAFNLVPSCEENEEKLKETKEEMEMV